jgi:uncharacterized FlgJ-related protein
MSNLRLKSILNATNVPILLNRNGLTYKQADKTIFVPLKWIILVSILLIGSILSFLFMITIESDAKIKTVFIKNTTEITATETPPSINEIILYEYVIGNDTMFMNEDQSDRFKRIILKAIENEKLQVQNIKIELKQKFDIVRSDTFLLSEIRHTTRKRLFFEIPSNLLELHFPIIEIETKIIKITTQPISTVPTVTPNEKLVFNRYTEKQARAYIEKYKALAILERTNNSIPVYVTLSQGLLESCAGGSKLAQNNNNHFGIKCFSKNCAKGHCTNHFDDNHKDFFRTFTSVKESFKYHSNFLHKDRYKHLLKLDKKDYKGWCHGLKKAGYATDNVYAYSLIKIIEKYKLNEI